jgi:hypothetical protein
MNEAFICVQCFVSGRKIEIRPSKGIITAKTNNPPNSEARLVKCSICGEEYWLCKK